MKQTLAMFGEILKIVLIASAIVIPLRLFLIQPFFVQGASMEPNYENGEYLVIDEISYRLGEPQRGEVIVFKYPLNPKDFFIKRIIGLPGESVLVQDNKITIKNAPNPNGFVLDESEYLKNVPPLGNHSEVVLGADEFYVMGDNRAASFDSRRGWLVPEKNIVGRVWVRIWPFGRFMMAESPSYLNQSSK